MAPPVNDDFADRIDLGSDPTGAVAGTLIDATVEGAEPTPTNPGIALDASVWYEWTSPLDGAVTFTTDGSATGDTVIGVYDDDGTLAGLTELGSNDDDDNPTNSTWSSAQVPVTNGQLVRIQVATYPGSDPDAFTLTWHTCTPQDFDAFANALEIGAYGAGHLTESNECATVEVGEPGATAGDGFAHRSLWFKRTATRDATVTVTMEGSTSALDPTVPLSAVLGVWQGPTLGALAEVLSDSSSAPDGTPELTYDETAGQTYYWQVCGYSDTDVGTYEVRFAEGQPDLDFATIPSAARQGGIDLTDVGASFTDRISIEVIDPDDDVDAVLGVVTDAAKRSFLDESKGSGAFGFQVQNRVADGVFPGSTPMVANPSLALLQRRRFARFNLDGEPVFTGYIEGRRRRIRSQRKEGDQFTAVAGRRWEAWLDKARVDAPGRFHVDGSGLLVGPVPLNKARRFNYTEPSYDTADWPYPIELVRSDGIASPAWTGNPPGWPDPTSYWIGRPGMTVWPAPGTFGASTDYYWGLFVAPSNDSFSVYGTADDALVLHLLGTKLWDTDDGFGHVHKWTGDLETGVFYTLAAKVRNSATITENPSGLNVTVIRDRDGLVIFNTANNGLWKVLPTPPFEPGMTAGHVLEILYIEALSRHKLFGWTLGFNGYVDSNGRPWPVVNDIVLTTGDAYTMAMRRIGEAFADLRPSRAGGRLDAYVKGTAGRVQSVGFIDHDTEEPDQLANITELDIAEVNERGTTVIFVWKSGSFKLVRPGFEFDGDDETLDAEDYLELGEVDSLEAALGLAAEYAAIAADPHVTLTVAIRPRDSADSPYEGFDLFDTVPINASNLNAEGEVNDVEWESTEGIASISMTQDDHGSKAIHWGVELRDKWQDRDDRFTTLLQRVSPGGGGTTSNATSARPDDGLPTDVQAQVVAMGMPAGATGDAQGPVPVPGNGFMRQFVVRRDDPSDTTVVTLSVSGVVVATVTIPDGELLGRANPSAVTPVQTHLDWFTSTIVLGNDSATVALAVVELTTQK